MTDAPRLRIERDTMGEMEVPAGALYGAQTARAVANFPISGWRLPGSFLAALARIKAAYARANAESGLLPREHAGAIVAAAARIAAGELDEHFPLDVFQTGSGTSTNMNVNEVLAHLANLSLGGDPVGHRPVHPNDHVNLGQSSNDVVPAALRLAALDTWRNRTGPALAALAKELEGLSGRHRETITLGRTHLMDAMPTTYGRIFAGWKERFAEASERIETVAAELRQLPLGGTAVGTGVSAEPSVVRRALALLSEEYRERLGLLLLPETGIGAQDCVIAMVDAHAAAARVLLAVANDLRLRGSGPFGGLGELRLPAVQPGSSIMPGKVNPVIPEAAVQVALQIEGLAGACRSTAVLHQLELSHANPLLAWNLDTIGRLLANVSRLLAERCLAGLEVDVDRCRAHAGASPALATALASKIGYERAAEVAKEAEVRGESVAAVARRMGVLPEARLDEVLDLDRVAGLEGEGKD